MYVTQESIERARKADLHGFLLARHKELFIREGRSLRLKSNKSISIREGYHAYRDFSSGEYGNSITFLIKYLGYSFQDAVIALCGTPHSSIVPDARSATLLHDTGKNGISLPEPAPLPHRRMYGFLISRGIPKEMISVLVSRGLVYQSAEGNNVVFVNKEMDYCELRGTYTYAEKPFRGCRKTKADRFWYFLPKNKKPVIAYVTEGAIDAISLFLLHKRAGADTSCSVYISIGGVGNIKTISRIKRQIRTILAVDNDAAGELCRKQHEELEYIIPVHKDWNDDLRSLTASP